MTPQFAGIKTGADDGGVMENAKTKKVLDYWTDLRGTATAPARSDVTPQGLRSVLPYVFLADAVSPDVTRFRLAGTGLCERYGRELRDHNLQTMWTPSDRVALRGLIVNVLKAPVPGLATFRAETIDRRSIAGEMLLLPLIDDQGDVSKLLGCAFAIESTAKLGQRPLVHQRLESIDLLHDHRLEALAEEATHDAAPIPAPPEPIRRKGHLSLIVSQDLPNLTAHETGEGHTTSA